MKWRHLVLVAFLIALLGYGAIDAKQASASSLQVTAQIGLNLREGPGFEYNIITVMPWGSYVEGDETSGDWTSVSFNGLWGWAYTSWLTGADYATSYSESAGSYASACTWAWGSEVCAPDYIVNAIYSAAATYGVSGDWLFQVAACESNFDPGTVGDAGEIGLFQFLPDTYYTWGSGDIWDVWNQTYTAAYMFSLGLSYYWMCA